MISGSPSESIGVGPGAGLGNPFLSGASPRLKQGSSGCIY